MNIGEILVRFSADISGFMGGIRTATAALGGFGTAVVAVTALAAGLAVILGVVSVKAAADFQQGLNRLVTGAGDVTDNMGRMGQSILGISTATGVLTGELLPAMYQIISAGQRGAQAQDTLKVAAMGSVAEQAKIVDVAKALTTAMTDYGTSQFNATQFMNGYTRATQLGKLTLEQLSTSMGPILPLAHNIGISFADVAGAMSTMTNAGIPAERAATSLRFLFQSLENPTHKATLAMESMGLSSVAVGNELKVSLPGALEMIYKAALRAGPEGSVPFNRAVSDMIGGQRSLQAYLSLTGSHFSTYRSNTQAIADAMNHSKTAVLGWDTAQQNFNTRLSQAHAALDALFITIGTHLLPVLTQIVGQIVPIIQRFTEWVLHTHAIENAIKAATPYFAAMFDVIKAALPTVIGLFLKFMQIISQASTWVARHKEIMDALMVVMKALGIVILVVVVAALLILAASFAATVAVITVVLAVVAGLIAIWNLLVIAAHAVAAAWQAGVAFLVALWHTLVATAISVFNAVKNAIVTAFNATIAWIVGAWNAAIAFIVSIWQRLSGFATSVFNAVKTAIMTAINAVITWLVQAWQTCVTTVVGWFTWLYNHNYYFKMLVDTIRNVVQGVITWLQTAWSVCVSFVTTQWNRLIGFASSIFNSVKNAISSAVSATVSWLQNAWSTAVAWVGQKWNEMKALAQSAWDGVRSVFSAVWGWMSGIFNSIWSSISSWWNTAASGAHDKANTLWQNVSSVFSSAWSTYISGPLSSLGNSIGNFFSDLASKAVAWGAHVIQGVVDGINSMIGTVRTAASNIAATVASFLGFHSPTKEGPGRELDIWGPNLAAGFAAGIVRGIPQVEAAVRMMVSPLPTAVSGSVSAAGTAPLVGTAPLAAAPHRAASSEETNALLRQISRQLDSGRRVTREELIQAMGTTLSERVMQYGRGR